MFKSHCCAIYLNRLCPRHCPYCSVVSPRRDRCRLSVDQWKSVFSFLNGEWGIEFFLILGTEPLLLGDDLVELVKFWDEKNLKYGLYSTSPQPLFDKMKDKLLDAGLHNWSAGMDYIDEVYYLNKKLGKLSYECICLVEKQRDALIKKARDSFNGIRYMSGIDETLVLITISRMNIEFIPEMIQWLCDNLSERTVISLNFVEWKRKGDKNFDFVTERDKAPEFFFDDSDWGVWIEFIYKLSKLPIEYLARVQVPRNYFSNWNYILELNRPGDPRWCSLGIDCDGTLRVCGYKKGTLMPKYNILEVMKKPKLISHALYDDWCWDVKMCSGCYWAWPCMIKEFGWKIVDFYSEQWKVRKEVWRNYWENLRRS